MKTKNAVNGSVPSSTGTGAGSASNPTPLPPAAAGSTATAGASVVGPKGLRLRLEQMLAGFQSALPAGAILPGVALRGSPLSQAAVLAQLQGLVGNYTSLDAATVAEKAARAPVTQSEPVATALLAQLKVSLETFFGATSPERAFFGLTPKRARTPLTGEQLAARAARAKNTRTIRATKGKLQKATLVSGPMQVTVAPAAQPVAPASTPSAVQAAAIGPTPPGGK